MFYSFVIFLGVIVMVNFLLVLLGHKKISSLYGRTAPLLIIVLFLLLAPVVRPVTGNHGPHGNPDMGWMAIQSFRWVMCFFVFIPVLVYTQIFMGRSLLGVNVFKGRKQQ